MAVLGFALLESGTSGLDISNLIATGSLMSYVGIQDVSLCLLRGAERLWQVACLRGRLA